MTVCVHDAFSLFLFLFFSLSLSLSAAGFGGDDDDFDNIFKTPLSSTKKPTETEVNVAICGVILLCNVSQILYSGPVFL